MKKWEYAVEDINQRGDGTTTHNEVEEQKMLDIYGSDGWELVTIATVEMANNTFRRAYFKKRIG